MSVSSESAPSPFSLPGVVPPCLGSRELFPHLAFDAYLAHAAISPACQAVAAAVESCVVSVSRWGVGSFTIWNAQRERLRASAGALMGASADSVALTAGCTRGIADLALALPWRPGDVLLTYRGEFPANVVPWQLAARAHGAEVEFLDLPDSREPDCVDRIMAELDEALLRHRRARWVAVSAVQFQSGLRMPLGPMARACHARGIRLFVDGIQALGVVPLDVQQLGIDAFFVGGHKWLLGLEGVGFAYFSPALMKELSPVTAGWLSYPEGEGFLFRGPGHLRYDRKLLDSPRVFEGSTANAIGFAALEAGVDLVSQLSPQSIYDHVQAYHDAIESEFVKRGFVSLRASDRDLRSCLLSFVPPTGCQVPNLAAALRARSVVVSIPDGLVRLSPHFANSVTEIPQVLDALDEALAGVAV
jgi:cysteine desulfurase/selenocysteine lyase